MQGSSMCITKQVATALLIVSGLTAFAFGKKKEAVQHAPLPAMVLTAKTIYIDNKSDRQAVADMAYTQLMKWGKYKVVDSKEKADLVLVLTLAYSHTEREDSDYVSLYNNKTGAWTSGNVPGGTSTITWTYTQMRLVDPKTTDVMWADQRVWLRKGSATEWLIQSLRQRVEEQENGSTR